ncbi:TPA: hypothetical protein N0F65_012527 [Lagenidium giganteum]|uniref:Uncharacterized protein n=1 Tax=Lagenidium giganteum TaxID=4803 RepID=A0AAV2YNB3_9STRA|nr:TPA: hypothetical protein N0F65_012527 [Lagenidium giganteum]
MTKEKAPHEHVAVVVHPTPEEGLARPAPPPSMTQRFFSIRHPAVPKAIDTGPLTATQRVDRVLKQYASRICGKRCEKLRHALRIPDDEFSDSRDAYNPKKKPLRFIHIHKEELDVSRDFFHKTRHLLFEREVVDREVCDLMDNRAIYNDDLAVIYAMYGAVPEDSEEG